MAKIFDISPLISAETAVFPGDQKFTRQVSFDFKNQDHLLLSSIQTTLHIGAHTDAPNHYAPNGESIAQRSLEYYLGPAQVISVNIPRGTRIKPDDLKQNKILAPRVLFKTNTFPSSNRWNEDFAALSLELVEFLSAQGVQLVGIDTPSVDLGDDKILQSHKMIYKKNMSILEGIVLSEVPDGLYTLISLPLKIAEADASPVRAVLVEGQLESLWKK